jgi:hypothetical protein
MKICRSISANDLSSWNDRGVSGRYAVTNNSRENILPWKPLGADFMFDPLNRHHCHHG